MGLILALLLSAASQPQTRLDDREVSIEDFEAFVQQGWATDAHWTEDGRAWRTQHPQGASPTTRASGRSGEHPVVAVTRYEAEAYCAWKGQRLPTAEEWGAAACPSGRIWPWGDTEDGGNWNQGGKRGLLERVRTEPPTGQPLEHTGGNVWEWTTSPWAQGSEWTQVRGGSYMNLASYCRCDHVEPVPPDQARLTLGFRCSS